LQSFNSFSLFLYAPRTEFQLSARSLTRVPARTVLAILAVPSIAYGN
jgi:hypothetical protein